MKFDSRICIFITKKIPYVGRDGKRRFEKSENDDVITQQKNPKNGKENAFENKGMNEDGMKVQYHESKQKNFQ